MSPENRDAFENLAGRMNVRWEEYEESLRRAQEDDVSQAIGMDEPGFDGRGGRGSRASAVKLSQVLARERHEGMPASRRRVREWIFGWVRAFLRR
jgi:hypothetical protein